MSDAQRSGSPAIAKGYAESRFGQLHYAESGSGAPVLLLHQTPRSWDEYREVLPLLGATRHAVAMDTLGFGASARTPEPFRIELFADAVEDLIESLGLRDVSLVGHHTGGVVAIEVAARRGTDIANLVLSGVPYVDAPRRARVADAPPIDHVTPAADGSHLVELWNRRRPFYPADRPDLLARLVADGVRVLDRVEEGHRAVNAYRMEDRIRLVRSRTLVLCGEEDAYSLPDVPRLCAAVPGSTSAVLPGTGVPSVDHRPDLFAAAVGAFLDEGAAGR
ncbi:alpha/beta fold hydrolase [Nocardioides carbamazepini]|uniref:alpha/beta fold hydrolase n=1 Tax=Nocardioides carbamazepini TaxID=2854259 RepID=UPI002149B9AF|nr:alpha/beta fold hydrolase [Nocardioides carbamazepini]MCR1784387.1 alpha/beta fold hydrolase [Nocardioides carbamazepini]